VGGNEPPSRLLRRRTPPTLRAVGELKTSPDSLRGCSPRGGAEWGKSPCPPSEGGEVRGLESQQDESGRVPISVDGNQPPSRLLRRRTPPTLRAVGETRVAILPHPSGGGRDACGGAPFPGLSRLLGLLLVLGRTRGSLGRDQRLSRSMRRRGVRRAVPTGLRPESRFGPLRWRRQAAHPCWRR